MSKTAEFGEYHNSNHPTQKPMNKTAEILDLLASYLKEMTEATELAEKGRIQIRYANILLKQYTSQQQAVDKELHDKITQLQEKYDENGYDCSPIIKLQRIESHIDAALKTYSDESSQQQASQEVDRWISVETRPKRGSDPKYKFASDMILLTDGEFVYYGQYENSHLNDEDGVFLDANGDDFSDDGIEITHWQPLPPAPKTN